MARIDADPQRGRIVEALATLVGRADLGRALTTSTKAVRWPGPDLARRVAGALYDYRDRQGSIAQPVVQDPDPTWRPPELLALLEQHVVALHDAIEDRARMIIADASTAGPLWWPAAAALDSVLAGDIAVYRDTWGVTDMTTTLGHEPAANSHHQHAQWQTLQLRLDHVRRRDLDGNGRDDHADVFDRDGNGIDDQVDFELAERVATLHERVTNWRVVAAAPSVGIDDWRSREPHHQLDRSFER